MAEELILSVVLATYNRAETLRETLRHLAEQELGASLYEVIVIDDGSPDHTQQVVEEVRSGLPYELIYLRHENSGAGYSQNRGIREARAPLLLFMADDIFMSPAALATHVREHEENPEPGVAVLGCVLQDPQPGQSVFMQTWDPFRFQDQKVIRELPYYMFWANNISCKRDFMLEHGLFREQMGRAGPHSHHDVEAGYRLHKKGGLRILFAAEALGYHHHIVTIEGEIARQYQRGLNWSEFHEQCPEPELSVRYHYLDWSTLGDHWRALTGPNRRYLFPADRNPVSLVVRHLMRLVLFNNITVPLVWLPLFERAETNPRVAKIMRRQMYRGVFYHSSLRGYKDAKRKYGAPGPGRTAKTVK